MVHFIGRYALYAKADTAKMMTKNAFKSALIVEVQEIRRMTQHLCASALGVNAQRVSLAPFSANTVAHLN